MADVEKGPFSLAGVGTPQNTSGSTELDQQGSGEQQAGEGHEYMTKGEVLQLVQKLESRLQSLTDKTIDRVQKVVSAAAQSGVQLTPQQAESLLETMDSERGTAARPTNSQRQPAQAQPKGSEGQPDQLDPVVQAAFTMMQRAGVTIDQGDPELSMVNNSAEDEAEFLLSVKQAIAAKKQRLQQSLPARMPGLAAGGGIGKGGSKAAITAELSDLLQSPSKNIARIRELKAELAKYT